MKFDVSKTGLEMVLKPWEADAMKYLWSCAPEYVGSSQVYEHLKGLGRSHSNRTGRSISRASVINFLNYAADHGWISHKETSGRGGMRRIYCGDERRLSFFSTVCDEVSDAVVAFGKLASVPVDEL